MFPWLATGSFLSRHDRIVPNAKSIGVISSAVTRRAAAAAAAAANSAHIGASGITSVTPPQTPLVPALRLVIKSASAIAARSAPSTPQASSRPFSSGAQTSISDSQAESISITRDALDDFIVNTAHIKGGYSAAPINKKVSNGIGFGSRAKETSGGLGSKRDLVVQIVTYTGSEPSRSTGSEDMRISAGPRIDELRPECCASSTIPTMLVKREPIDVLINHMTTQDCERPTTRRQNNPRREVAS
ncbi:unnamed protein product, partial [Protopolystoma xenopodis]